MDENGEPRVMYHGSPTAGNELLIGRAVFRFSRSSNDTRVRPNTSPIMATDEAAIASGKALNQTIAKQPASVNIDDVKILDMFLNNLSYSVNVPSARTWDKYPDSRKFKGRDDGNLRVEDVEQNKGVTETLEATRLPKSGPQGSTPKGRIHRNKGCVNYIDSLGEDSFRLIIRLIIGLNMVAYLLYGR